MGEYTENGSCHLLPAEGETPRWHFSSWRISPLSAAPPRSISEPLLTSNQAWAAWTTFFFSSTRRSPGTLGGHDSNLREATTALHAESYFLFMGFHDSCSKGGLNGCSTSTDRCSTRQPPSPLLYLAGTRSVSPSAPPLPCPPPDGNLGNGAPLWPQPVLAPRSHLFITATTPALNGYM